MNAAPFVFLLVVSILLSGCQSVADQWAKKAANSFLKTTGIHQEPVAGQTSEISMTEIRSAPVRGIITLIGPDTTIVGTRLDTGFAGTMPTRDAQQPDYVIVADSASSLSYAEPSALGSDSLDPENGMVLVVTDAQRNHGVQGISMSIVVDYRKYDYLCTTDSGSSAMEQCGNGTIVLDIPNRFLNLSNAKVNNADTGAVLRLNGRLDW